MLMTGRPNNGAVDGMSAVKPNLKTSVLRQIFLGLIVITPIITPGMSTTFSAIALPQMKLNLDEASWFGSITSIACPFGCLFTGLTIDKYGRRAAMLSSIIPNIVGWFLLVNRNASLEQLYCGRLLTGFAVGAASLPSIVYAAECITVNSLRIRSSIGTWSTLSMTTGGLFVFGFGAFMSYDQVALIAAFLSILSLILIVCFIPESPNWLYRKGRLGDAEVAQQRLGIKQPILQNRRPILDHSETSITLFETYPEPDDQQKFSVKDLIHYLAKIKGREVYKPLMITISFLFFSQFSGLYCLQSYMVDVITVQPLKLNPYILSVVCGALQLFGCLLLTFLLPYSGVKTLSVISFLCVSVGFIVLAFSMLLENSTMPNTFNYIHIISIWSLMVMGNLGLLAIPYSILGEMFPMGAKGYASLSLFACSVFNFIVLKIFPYLFTLYKGLVFFGFSIVCAAGAVFVIICLTETVGKTIDEINNSF